MAQSGVQESLTGRDERDVNVNKEIFVTLYVGINLTLAYIENIKKHYRNII